MDGGCYIRWNRPCGLPYGVNYLTEPLLCSGFCSVCRLLKCLSHFFFFSKSLLNSCFLEDTGLGVE